MILFVFDWAAEIFYIGMYITNLLHFLATVLIITKIAFSVNLYADFSLYFTYFLLIFPTFLLNLPFYYKTKLPFIFYFSIYFSIRDMYADFSLSY